MINSLFANSFLQYILHWPCSAQTSPGKVGLISSELHCQPLKSLGGNPRKALKFPKRNRGTKLLAGARGRIPPQQASFQTQLQRCHIVVTWRKQNSNLIPFIFNRKRRVARKKITAWGCAYSQGWSNTCLIFSGVVSKPLWGGKVTSQGLKHHHCQGLTQTTPALLNQRIIQGCSLWFPLPCTAFVSPSKCINSSTKVFCLEREMLPQ